MATCVKYTKATANSIKLILEGVKTYMKLLTKEIITRLPKLYETEETDDKILYVKFFNPTGAGTWYGAEYDPETRTFFGYVSLFNDPMMDEWGYFSLDELESVKGLFGLGIERDLHFKPTKFSELSI